MAFIVKSGSLADLSKKEKHKSSLGQLSTALGTVTLYKYILYFVSSCDHFQDYELMSIVFSFIFIPLLAAHHNMRSQFLALDGGVTPVTRMLYFYVVINNCTKVAYSQFTGNFSSFKCANLCNPSAFRKSYVIYVYNIKSVNV